MKSSNSYLDSMSGSREICRMLRVTLAVVCFSQAAQGLDPNRALSQYVRDRWGPDHGLPRGPIYAIDQSTDGYLWIGTEKGLVRFDGLGFVLVRSAQPEQPAPTHVLGLMADREGGLLLRLRRPNATMLRYQTGVFHDGMADFGRPRGSVAVNGRDKDGNPLLWILKGEGSAIVLKGGRFETLASPPDFSRSPVLAIAQTGDGSIWVGTRDAGLFRLKDGVTSAIKMGLPDLKVNTLVAAGNELWVGTDHGLVRWDGSRLTKKGIPSSLDDVQILAMTLDANSNLWGGTNSQGLFRLSSKGVSWMDPSPGETREAVTAVFEDREGNLWSGSASGLERIRDSVFVTYSSAEGLSSDSFGPIYVDSENGGWFAPMSGGLSWWRDGRLVEVNEAGLNRDVIYSITGGRDGLWIGRQNGGLTRLRRQGASFTSTTYRSTDGLAQNSVYAVHESRDGAVWAATLSGGISRLYGDKFTTYTTGDGLASNTVASILEDSTGRVWFATPIGLTALTKGQWRTYRVADGLPSDNVNCLLEDSSGMLWIGTSAGLAFQGNGRMQSPLDAPAPLREQILGLAQDRAGSLWIATATKVIRVKRDALVSGRIHDGDLREYALADGLRGVEGVKRHKSVVTDSLGRVWFSLNRGISVVHPELLASSSAPAIVQIQNVSADGHPIKLQGGLRIPGGSRRVVFGYAGLSLSVPDRVRFRYLLEEFDPNWSEPVSAREAVYTNLGPGHYRFRVIASNPDGVWNNAESTIEFDVAPLTWQTWWFRLAAVSGIGFAITALYRLRLMRMTSRLNVRFEERLAERTRIAQELHDTLLQGFLSASMQLHVATDRLSEDSPAKPSINRVLNLMGRVIDEGRNAVRGLRSADNDGSDLARVFSRIQDELGMDDACDFRVIVEGETRPLHPVLRDEVYRIGREALVNAFRHSRAKNIEMELDYAARRFRMLIRDNGCGIDARVLRSGREGHWGLTGMRERAEKIGAQFHVRSSSSAGTEVELLVPGPIAFPVQARDGLLRRLVHRYAQKAQTRVFGGGGNDGRPKTHSDTERG
ncbi:MAG: hypothetical protein K2X03_11385 [Bryobacteraceae bacterium]|nr:hypothetical protein [Bryobacteraceae bacterium]